MGMFTLRRSRSVQDVAARLMEHAGVNVEHADRRLNRAWRRPSRTGYRDVAAGVHHWPSEIEMCYDEAWPDEDDVTPGGPGEAVSHYSSSYLYVIGLLNDEPLLKPARLSRGGPSLASEERKGAEPYNTKPPQASSLLLEIRIRNDPDADADAELPVVDGEGLEVEVDVQLLSMRVGGGGIPWIVDAPPEIACALPGAGGRREKLRLPPASACGGGGGAAPLGPALTAALAPLLLLTDAAKGVATQVGVAPPNAAPHPPWSHRISPEQLSDNMNISRAALRHAPEVGARLNGQWVLDEPTTLSPQEVWYSRCARCVIIMCVTANVAALQHDQPSSRSTGCILRVRGRVALGPRSRANGAH